MGKYRKKPIVVEAERWFKNGDHSQDGKKAKAFNLNPDDPPLEGDIVRYYRTPDLDAQEKCSHCGLIMYLHGWIETLEGGHIVCPGDYIITGIQGERYPCKPDIFEATNEKVLSV